MGLVHIHILNIAAVFFLIKLAKLIYIYITTITEVFMALV